MTRLPWQHGRSRTKSGSEKNGFGGPQDWFSRTTTEPSRQALTELVKQHKREQSDGSDRMSPTSRLRSHTSNSQDSRVPSSCSDDTTSNFWYPSNGHDSSSIANERQDGTTKVLLNKGSFMLRRTGSKMSLSSNGSSSTLGFTSPSRTHSINTSNTRRSSRDDVKNKISAPFDFQHVTHTEQTHFPGLGRIEESELAYRFSTIALGQKSINELKGIETSDILRHGQNSPAASQHTRQATSRPASPQRPAPPPKDDISGQTVTTEINLPSAAYSPLKLSPVSPAFSQSYLSSSGVTTNVQQDTSAPSGNLPRRTSLSFPPGNELVSKPLPQLPVIHAVTTEDNSAREMIGAPLPTTPGSISPASDTGSFNSGIAHQRQKSSIALPRHYTLYPNAKSSMPNLLSADRALNPSSTLSRVHSDMALSRQAREHQLPLSTRTSMSFAAIDTMDWEAAVDEAWDTDDQEMSVSVCHCGSPIKGSPPAFNTATEQTAPTGSRPAVMASHQPSLHAAPNKPLPVPETDVHKLDIVQEHEVSDLCAGLGISSFSSVDSETEVAKDSTSLNAALNRSQSSASSQRQHCLTRSSSQESVIYSLASSIIETQRSSKSSVFTGDLNTRRMDDLTEVSGEEPELTTIESHTRPESSCLPSDILEQYQSIYGNEAQKLTEKAAVTVPDAANHKHTKSASKFAVPERRSSIIASPTAHTTRNRSNTFGSRPRQNSRVSYSLFPTGSPAITSPPIPS